MIIIKNNIIKIPIKKDVTLTKFINLLFIKIYKSGITELWTAKKFWKNCLTLLKDTTT